MFVKHNNKIINLKNITGIAIGDRVIWFNGDRLNGEFRYKTDDEFNKAYEVLMKAIEKEMVEM